MPDTTWLSRLIELWPILSSLTPLILLGGFYWLQTKFPGRADFNALSANVSKIDDELNEVKATAQRLSEERDAPPTRVQLLEEIAGLKGRVSGLEAGVEGISRQLGTANEYLQILVERGLSR